MQFWADLHIHSKYSIATSKDCDPENLVFWAKRKGLALIGTGDFTHPAWREELKEKLEPAEDGLWKLKPEYAKALLAKGVPHNAGPEVRFVISGEISTIYKKNGRTRKVHHLLLLPGFKEAEQLAARLDRIGNIKADGRPILGLDSRNLVEMTMETSPRAIYIPAHIWTPHFSVFGANSGFDSLEECYEDLTGEIVALETGLSSDPAMNWRLSALDQYALISNSDAHSPRNLAREANLFDFDLSYDNLRSALKNPEGNFLGTVEFFPEEGKYHWDGHRACGVQWEPKETKKAGLLCPVCGKKVTVGVLHRVEVLADRDDGFRPASARPYERLVSLPKVIASAVGAGEKSKKVEGIYEQLLSQCGPELMVLREVPLEEIKNIAGTLVCEGIRRNRLGLLEVNPGFDGQYGKITIFCEDERQAYLGQAALFAEASPVNLPSLTAESVARKGTEVKKEKKPEKAQAIFARLETGELNPEQEAAALSRAKGVLVLAGPGTGKTRTLLFRVKSLLAQGVNPGEITCITFTKKAAEDLRIRLEGLLNTEEQASNKDKKANRRGNIQVGNFHQLCLKLINSCPGVESLPLLSEYEAAGFLPEAKGVSLRDLTLAISKLKNRNLQVDDREVPEEWRDLYRRYQENLKAYKVLDFDELLVYTIELLEKRLVPPEVLKKFSHLLIDEFQDLTPLQYRLIRLFFGQSVFAIGDPDQSIYGFRGSDLTVFHHFLQDFSEREVFKLYKNYRSASHILDAANRVISYNQRIEPVENEALVREESGRIKVVKAAGEKSEAIAVAREVIKLVGGTDLLSAHGDHRTRGSVTGLGERASYSFGEIAILYRTGRQLTALEAALVKEGLPYKVVGEQRLLYTKKIRDSLVFFHALLEPADYLLLSALRLEFFDPGEDNLRKIWDSYQAQAGSQAAAPGGGEGFLRFITEYLQEPNPVLNAPNLQKFRAFLAAYNKYVERISNPPLSTFTEWITDRGWEQDDPEISELLGLAAFSTDLHDFFNRLKLGREGDLERLGRRGAAPEYINLMTLHAAKGLEYPVVLITGVEEGLIPFENKLGEVEVEEERRLFYVGMTRAKRELILFYAKRRRDFGRSKEHQESRFIAEMPQELLCFEESATIRRRKHVQKGLFKT